MALVTKQVKVECVGPKCGAVVSWITAKSERWRRVKQREHGREQFRGSHLGWCPICADKYEVEQ